MQVHANKVMRDSSAETNGHLSVSRRIPSNSYAWFQIFPLAFHSGFAVEALIAGIAKARRSTRYDLALDTFVKVIEAEGVHISIRELHRKEWRPAEPIVECQPTGDLPGVLKIEGEVILRQVFGIGIRLVKRG